MRLPQFELDAGGNQIQMCHRDAAIKPGAGGYLDVELLGTDRIPKLDLFSQHDIRIEGVELQAPYGERQAGLLLDPGRERCFEVVRLEQAEHQPEGDNQTQNAVEKDADRKAHGQIVSAE